MSNQKIVSKTLGGMREVIKLCRRMNTYFKKKDNNNNVMFGWYNKFE